MTGTAPHKITRDRLIAASMLIAVVFTSIPFQVFGAGLEVDVKANGKDSLTLSGPTESFTISLTTANATACELTSPAHSGISTSATMDIDPGHAYYPAIGGSKTFTVTCYDAGGASLSDSVTVTLPNAPPAVLSVDIKANGSDGPVTLAAGESYTYTWTSTNATACELTSPAHSGISTSGTSGTISAGHPFYPTAGGSVTLTIVCNDASSNTATDSVVVRLGAVQNQVTVDVKANGSDGPVTLTPGQTYVYTWTSTNATACEQTSPAVSGVTTSGTSSSIGPGHPFYPTAGGSVTITITCINATSSATDSVVITLAAAPNQVTVDVKANGSDGPVTIVQGETYVYTWTSTNATACEQTSPAVSGVTLSGTSTPIGPGHPFYPPVGGSVTITITCINATSSATDSVVINVVSPSVCIPPQITSDLTVKVDEDKSFTYTITVSGTPPFTFSIGTSTLPSTVHIATSTGVISGTFEKSGTFTVVVSVTNNCGTDTETITFDVKKEEDREKEDEDNDRGRRRGRRGVSVRVEEPLAENLECFYIRDYMRKDFDNDPIEVLKLQSFLGVFEGYDVELTGVYDDQTIDAVNAFQLRYRDDVLTPWGHTAPTSYAYILTIKKVNEIYCETIFPLTDAQDREIVAFRALLESFRARGIEVDFGPTGTVRPTTGGGGRAPAYGGGGTTVTGTVEPGRETQATTTPILPVVGKVEEKDKGQTLGSLAAAVLAAPSGFGEITRCVIEFVLVLFVLYILANVLKSVFYEDKPENVRKRFFAKWIIFSVSAIIALIVTALLEEWCLFLPLLITLVFALVWMALYPRHGSLKSSADAWYGVIAARSRSMLGRNKNIPEGKK